MNKQEYWEKVASLRNKISEINEELLLVTDEYKSSLDVKKGNLVKMVKKGELGIVTDITVHTDGSFECKIKELSKHGNVSNRVLSYYAKHKIDFNIYYN